MMIERFYERLSRWRTEDLLEKYPGLRLVPSSTHVQVAGDLAFSARGPATEQIADQYAVALVVPLDYPETIPSVWETGGRIPNSFHKMSDGSLCLGSPTRLRLSIVNSPTLRSFVERCLVPYLYGYSYFERHSILPFGELDHGEVGIRQDLASLYGTCETNFVPQFLRLTSFRKRKANKAPCPCGSSLRLGKCHNRQVNRLRDNLGRRWFRMVLLDLRGRLVQ